MRILTVKGINEQGLICEAETGEQVIFDSDTGTEKPVEKPQEFEPVKRQTVIRIETKEEV